MIRVAFRYNDKRLFSRLVCLVQGGDVAHCELAYRWDGALHRCVSSSYLDGGVRLKYIDMPLSKWRIYEIKDRDADDILNWYNKHLGKKYDILGLLGFIFRRIEGDHQKYFCSEVAAEVLGFTTPWRYDLALLESVCKRLGKEVTEE